MCQYRSKHDNIHCRDFPPFIKRNRGMIDGLSVSALSSTGMSIHRPFTYSKLTLVASPLEISKRARSLELFCRLLCILLFCRKSQDNISCGFSKQTMVYTVNILFSIDYKTLSKAIFLSALLSKH